MRIKSFSNVRALLCALLFSLPMALSAQNVGIGTAAPVYKLHVIGDIYADGGWFRVSGNQGLYWESWGGGWYMSDGTWIRTYNNRNVWAGAGLLGSDGGLTIGAGGTTPPGAGAIIMGNTGMGTASPSQKLSVQGSMEIVESFDNVLLSRNTAQNRHHQMIGTYMGWDQGAIFLGGYNVNNPGGFYSSSNKVICGGTGGSIPIYATNFFTSSSARYKRDFAPIGHGLDAVMQLNPLSYHYNFEQADSQRRHMGMIAEEVDKVVPEAVSVENGQCLGIDYSSLVPVLVKAMQEQQGMIEAQQRKIEALEQEVKAMGGR